MLNRWRNWQPQRDADHGSQKGELVLTSFTAFLDENRRSLTVTGKSGVLHTGCKQINNTKMQNIQTQNHRMKTLHTSHNTNLHQKREMGKKWENKLWKSLDRTRFWVHPLLQRMDKKGEYHLLIDDLNCTTAGVEHTLGCRRDSLRHFYRCQHLIWEDRAATT